MDCDESDEPPKKTAKLENEKVMKSHWYVLAIWNKKLEKLLDTSKDSKKNQDRQPCQDFFPQGLNIAFLILNDDDVHDWPPHMHDNINKKCHKLLDLCVRQLDEDQLPVLDLLAMLLNPDTEFHSFNNTRISDSGPSWIGSCDIDLYARSPADPSDPRGWLVDLINIFGNLGGFLVLLTRFQPGRRSLTIPMMHALLRPFGLCHELLTVNTIVKYFMPIAKRVQVILDALTDEEIKEVAKSTMIQYYLSATIKDIMSLVSCVPKQEKIIENLESFKQRIVVKLLKADEDTDESSNEVDSDLLLDQWNYLLEYFHTNWKTANEKTRKKMLYMLEQWAKEFKAATVNRVLPLLWDLAHSDTISTKIMEQALAIYAEILTYFSPRYGNSFMNDWLDKYFEEVRKNDKWTLPALRQIQEILHLRETNTYNMPFSDEISVYPLGVTHDGIAVAINALLNYMAKIRELVKENPKIDEKTFMPDGRYNHVTQLQERLGFLKYLLHYGDLSLKMNQIKPIWQNLVEQPIFLSDRETFLKWLSETDLDPTIIKDFFSQKILQLNPTLLTKNGFSCFENLFQEANKDVSTDNFIGIDYLWRVITTSTEEVARDGFDLLIRVYTPIKSRWDFAKSKIDRAFIAKCRNQMQVHSDTLSRLTGVENIEENYEKAKEIMMETRKMGRIVKFLEEYIEKCDWDGNKKSTESYVCKRIM